MAAYCVANLNPEVSAPEEVGRTTLLERVRELPVQDLGGLEEEQELAEGKPQLLP